MLCSVLRDHMKNTHNYDCVDSDYALLFNILKDISYKIPRKNEPVKLYVDKVNKTALTEFKRMKLSPPPQQPSQNQRPPQHSLPQPPQQHQTPMRPQQTQQQHRPVQYDIQTNEIDEVKDQEQEHDMIKYERDNLKAVNEQLTKQNKEILVSKDELQYQIDTLKSKLMAVGEKKERKIQLILNSHKATKGGIDTFTFPLTYKNVYKICLVSGVVECYNDFNIYDDNNSITITETEANRRIDITLENGNYDTESLVTILETKLNEHSDHEYMVQYDSVLNRVFFKMDEVFTIHKSPLTELLGFCQDRVEKNIYVSDNHPTLSKIHSCYLNVSANGEMLTNVQSNHEMIDGCFGVLYDKNEIKTFSPQETFEHTLKKVGDVTKIEIELFTQYKHYKNTDVSFELKFDMYCVE
jgi:hypothetical protein